MARAPLRQQLLQLDCLPMDREGNEAVAALLGDDAPSKLARRASLTDVDAVLVLEVLVERERVQQGRFVVQDRFRVRLFDSARGQTLCEAEQSASGRSVENYVEAHRGAVEQWLESAEQEGGALSVLRAALDELRERGFHYRWVLRGGRGEIDAREVVTAMGVEAISTREVGPGDQEVIFRSGAAAVDVIDALQRALSPWSEAEWEERWSFTGRRIETVVRRPVAPPPPPTPQEPSVADVQQELGRATRWLGDEFQNRAKAAGLILGDFRVAPLLLPVNSADRALRRHVASVHEDRQSPLDRLDTWVEWEREGLALWQEFRSTAAGELALGVRESFADVLGLSVERDAIEDTSRFGLQAMGLESRLFAARFRPQDDAGVVALREAGATRLLVPRLRLDALRGALEAVLVDLESGARIRGEVPLRARTVAALTARLAERP